MKYFFDLFELPHTQRKWILKERAKIDQFLSEGRTYAISDLEDDYLKEWNHWKEQVDHYAIQRKPGSREKVLEARFELTKYNEILKYCGQKNPNTMIKINQEV